ncbi:hypothetical protein EDB86DRAFT_3244251 [Lactarius hatsudake]|nr:hypothetical protein EDB86DRAFT_3244251 [Lactarius hatsudake]
MFSEVLKRRPAGRGGARDERGDYSRIPDGTDSYPHESHEPEPAEDISQAAVPASSAQPGPSGGSGSQELDNAEGLRLKARKQGEKIAKLLERAQKAFESGNLRLWEKLKKLVEKCSKAIEKFNKKAKEMIFRGESQRCLPFEGRRLTTSFVVSIQGAKPGEVDLHLLLVPEAIEMAEQSIQAATSKGDQTVRFITGKGKHSKKGPEILPALQEHMGGRGLVSEIDHARIKMPYLTEPSQIPEVVATLAAFGAPYRVYSLTGSDRKNGGKIDLHGLFVAEAVGFADQLLQYGESRGDQVMCFIVGTSVIRQIRACSVNAFSRETWAKPKTMFELIENENVTRSANLVSRETEK